MRYLSLFSGIEAATVAWKPLGWTPYAFAEIEKFPSAVLAHHYGSNMPGEPLSSNGVPNFGDVTKFKEWPNGPIDLICGGSPCQSFSVAGLRKGMDDPRGNLALVYLAIVNKYRPRWVVYENVPGLLSSNGGRDFGSFIGGLAELGYGFAYRVLDAQYVRVDGFGRAVPQRRRRVFVVGYLGDWRRAAAVLLEPQGMRGDSAPRREQGKRVAPTIASRPSGGGGLGTDFDLDGGLITSTGNVPHCLNAGGMGRQDFETETMIAHTLKGEGFDASEDGTGRGTPIVPVAFRDVAQALTSNYGKQADNSDTALGPNVVAYGLATSVTPKFGVDISPCVAFAIQAGALRENPNSGPDGVGVQANVSYTLEARAEVQAVQAAWAVRRLTPTECERLQGFPEIRKNVKINIWLEDKSQQFAGAETQCITSPSSVSIAGESVSSRSAKSAKQSSIKNRQGLDLPVVLHVLLNLERGAVEIHKAGRCLWSASIAEKQSLSPLHMPIDAFARLIAQITESAEKEAPVGREGSLANTPHSTHPVSGRSFVNVSGHEIERHAEGAAPSTDTLSRHTTSTTSDCGQSSPNSALTMTTLCCSVVAAIGSFIPEIMSQGNSFSVTVEAVRGFTNVPWGKKDSSPDGPRYKALGNSMACNVMRWIGRRIEMVEKITKEDAA